MFPYRSPIPQVRIPPISGIFKALGFRHGSERALKDSTHSYRKIYIASDGTCGRDLFNWKLDKVQNGLLRMTMDFLDRGGYGVKFWPLKEGTDTPHILEYPTDQQKWDRKRIYVVISCTNLYLGSQSCYVNSSGARTSTKCSVRKPVACVVQRESVERLSPYRMIKIHSPQAMSSRFRLRETPALLYSLPMVTPTESV